MSDIDRNLAEEEFEDEELGYGPDIITIVDENGNEKEGEVLDSICIDDCEYLVFRPIVTAENLATDDGEALILKVEKDEEGEYLDYIDDDDEFNRVAEIFEERINNY